MRPDHDGTNVKCINCSKLAVNVIDGAQWRAMDGGISGTGKEIDEEPMRRNHSMTLFDIRIE